MNKSGDHDFTLGELAFSALRQMKSRIAIADDDPDTLELLRLALRSPKTEICEATTGGELVQLMSAEGPFDLIVTDIHMPLIKGLEVLHSARAARMQTPALVTTGRTDPTLQTEVDSLGNARLLRKPFGILELRVAVADLMAAPAA